MMQDRQFEMDDSDDIFEEVHLDYGRKKEPAINPFKEMANLALYIILIVAITFLLVTYVAQRTVVDGNSMNNTLNNGDSVFIEKVSYEFGEPERYDVIVFNYMYKEDTHYIKRIIGLPGETVQIKGGIVYVDQKDGRGLQPLTDDVYGNAEIASGNYGLAAEPITLGEDEYFVLGDNRNNSHDSRKADVGLVSKDQIVGHAMFRIWPLNEIKWIW